MKNFRYYYQPKNGSDPIEAYVSSETREEALNKINHVLIGEGHPHKATEANLEERKPQ